MTRLRIRPALYLLLLAELFLASQSLIALPPNATSALLRGHVNNAATGNPIIGAKITVNSITTYSVSAGIFSMTVSPVGTFTITCTKPGFDAFTSAPHIFQDGEIFSLNINLQETTNPVPWVSAILDTTLQRVNISWTKPTGNYEVLYDDGIEDSFTVWGQSGNMNALKFTPLEYPAGVLGGSVNIGQATDYPPGSNPFVPFQIEIMDASGTGGTPGNIISGPHTFTPTAYGWFDFTLPAPVNITSGDFFMVMIQGGNAPNAAGLAIDLTTPMNRSYSRFVSGNGNWVPANGNFMIRALLNGAGGPPSLQELPESLLAYQVFRLRQGEESNPQVWVNVSYVASTSALDPAWPALVCGPWRWAVTAVYTGNRYSPPAFSNVIGKCWTAAVTLNLHLSCSGSNPLGTSVTLRNLVYTDTLYTASFDSTGKVIFPHVWKGSYSLTVKKFGYQDYQSTLYIMGETTNDINLLQRRSPPTNLSVDSLSLYSAWDVPYYNEDLLQEDWSGNFPPPGWTVQGGSNWVQSTSHGNPEPSANFTWTPRLYNYDQSIISPAIIGQNSPILTLKYDISLYNLSTSALDKMSVEISDGTSWHTLKTWDNAGGNIPWTRDELDISAFTNTVFHIRFRSSGADSYQINGWYIDNILVSASESAHLLAPCIYGYTFYLDNTLLATVTSNDYTIPGTAVKYDSTYTACVGAIYASGYSTRDCRQVTSRFLWPPRNFTGNAIESTAVLHWVKPGYFVNNDLITPQGILGYNIFRDDSLLTFISGANVLAFYDTGLDPGSYNYKVTAVYDLTSYGHPGLQGSSVAAGPLNLQIHYGRPLPFSETWDQGSFTFNAWTFPVGQGNWTITQNAGNPIPCAAFTGFPLQSGYNQILESPALDATPYSCAVIWLDFDLKLEDYNATGTEKLILEVEYNRTWHQKAEFVNSGSTGWIHYHYDISAVKQKGFRFRLRATGQNSGNIVNWYVDNFSIYPICLPAENLSGDAAGMDTHLNWNPPECNGGGIILNEGFEGADFPPANWNKIITNSSASWSHTGISSAVGVHTGNYSAGLYWDYNHQDEWIIARNVFVSGNLKFWSLAYQGSAHGDHYYVKVSTDQGQSWMTMLDMSALPPFPGTGGYNHWQQPYVVDMSAFFGDNVDIAWHATDGNGQGLWYYWAIDDCSVGAKKLLLKQTQPYYDIYRKNGTGNDFSKINIQPVFDTTYVDTNLPEGLYKYYVQIVNPVCTQSSQSDTVTVDVVTSISEIKLHGAIQVYPNPTHDQVQISSEFPVSTITLVNMLGEVVCYYNVREQKGISISLSTVNPGVYLLKILTGKSSINFTLIKL